MAVPKHEAAEKQSSKAAVVVVLIRLQNRRLAIPIVVQGTVGTLGVHGVLVLVVGCRRNPGRRIFRLPRFVAGNPALGKKRDHAILDSE